jgi:hypothetical protein
MRLTIVIPTKDKDGCELGQIRNIVMDTVLLSVSAEFGGFTAYSATGGWIDDSGKLVIEQVTVIESYTENPNINGINRHLDELASGIARDLNQNSVMFTIDSVAYFVS